MRGSFCMEVQRRDLRKSVTRGMVFHQASLSSGVPPLLCCGSLSLLLYIITVVFAYHEQFNNLSKRNSA